MNRSPAAAFWLSLLPGAGHIFIGQPSKGFALALVACGIFELGEPAGLLIPIFWLFVMLDAHRNAQRINQITNSGGQVEEFSFEAGAKWWGLVLVSMGIIWLLLNFDFVEYDSLRKFWPVTLIAMGVWLIIPGLRGTKSPMPPSPAPPPVEEEIPPAAKEEQMMNHPDGETEDPAWKGE